MRFYLLDIVKGTETSLLDYLFTSENMLIVLISFFSSIIGALIAQLFQISNIHRSEKTRIGGLLAEDKYKLFTRLSCLTATLLTFEDTATIYPSLKIPPIKGNPHAQYHAIFNSWDDFNAFYQKLDDIFKAHSFMFPIPVYILYTVFIKYWHLFSILVGGVYSCDDDTLCVFGLYCFSDITRWAELMQRQCNRMLNNPKLRVAFEYNARYKIIRRYYFSMFSKSNLSDLQNRFMLLDASKQGFIEYPDLFDSWYDIALSIQKIKGERVV